VQLAASASASRPRGGVRQVLLKSRPGSVESNSPKTTRSMLGARKRGAGFPREGCLESLENEPLSNFNKGISSNSLSREI